MKSNIEKLINEKGLLKKFVAKQVGVTPAQLSNWMRGNNYPTADKLFKLAAVLGCKIEDLYETEE
ncbi:helix-turn-helix transcriptional regulator [Priestia aryabhattai]|uniref:helix-turn-helix transcriptional regulator n=1 Tax=Priestia aryabhattai TaxID=412384 RepID=UPI0039A133F3